MTKSRFSGYEVNALDKANKLAGTKYPAAYGILTKACFITNPLEDMYMDMADDIGLYGYRIEMLYQACGCRIDKFTEAVSRIYRKGKFSQEYILSLKTQEEFNRVATLIGM